MHFSSPARILLLSFALLLFVGGKGQDSSRSDQEGYSSLIEKADSCFEEEAYGSAMEAYRKALEIHPEKEHPQKRIGKIESILSKDQEEKEDEKTKDVEDESSIWMVAEKEPTFPDGEEAMWEFIQEEMTYPDSAKRSGLEDTVHISFVVEKDGSLSRTKVTNQDEVPQLLAKEARRIIKKMPRWEPGAQKGKKVPVRVTIPVRFRLD